MAKKKTPPTQRRIAIYLDDSDYLQIKSKLTLEKETFSSWARMVIKEYLAKK